MTATRNFNAASRQDVYTRVTERILADLEAGTRPWMKPWDASNAQDSIIRPLRVTGEPYKGMNVLLLWGEMLDRGYRSPTWMTYRQSAELGGQVRKGEHGALVVYADRIKRTEHDDATGEDVEREIPFMKGYTVFNVEQIDGLPDRFYTPSAPPTPAFNRIAHADAFFQNTGARIRHGGSRAFYAMEPDYIQMPSTEAFKNAESYAATLAHELTHWTRHPTRLEREFGRKQWGDEGYAKEELVAEIGSAFLCADLQITPEVMPDHAAYIASWLQAMKNDKRFIFTAAGHAQRAVDYLHGLQPKSAVPLPS